MGEDAEQDRRKGMIVQDDGFNNTLRDVSLPYTMAPSPKDDTYITHCSLRSASASLAYALSLEQEFAQRSRQLEAQGIVTRAELPRLFTLSGQSVEMPESEH